MSLSYGEMSAIEAEWTRYKEEHADRLGRIGSSMLALEFLMHECREVYPTEDEQDEIFNYIGCLEEWE